MKCFTAGLGGFGCFGDLGKIPAGTVPYPRQKPKGGKGQAAKEALALGKQIAKEFSTAVRVGNRSRALAIAHNPHANVAIIMGVLHPGAGVDGWNQGITELPVKLKDQLNSKWTKFVTAGLTHLTGAPKPPRHPGVVSGLGEEFILPLPVYPGRPLPDPYEDESHHITPLYAEIDPEMNIRPWPELYP